MVTHTAKMARALLKKTHTHTHAEFNYIFTGLIFSFFFLSKATFTSFGKIDAHAYKMTGWQGSKADCGSLLAL